MLVLLPPPETKAPAGDGPPVQLDGLAHPELTPTRRKLADADGVARIVRRTGLCVEHSGEHALDVVVPAR